jgi:hypothetical protein
MPCPLPLPSFDVFTNLVTAMSCSLFKYSSDMTLNSENTDSGMIADWRRKNSFTEIMMEEAAEIDGSLVAKVELTFVKEP